MNGPEQGGATGTFDSNIEEGHLYIPPDPAYNNTQANLIRNILVDKFGTRANPLCMTTGCNILDEYTTPLLQSMCFPRLFSYGMGDISRISCRYNITLTQNIWYLINYAIANNVDGDGYFYLFAMHNI